MPAKPRTRSALQPRPSRVWGRRLAPVTATAVLRLWLGSARRSAQRRWEPEEAVPSWSEEFGPTLRLVQQQPFQPERQRASSGLDHSTQRASAPRIKPPRLQQDWKALGDYGTLGLEVALSVAVGLFGGQWLDKKLGTGGWLTWVGFAYGLAAAARAIYRAVRKSTREAEELERRDEEARKKYGEDGQE